MTIWGKLAGAAAGFAIGGPIGALIGGVTGHYVIDRNAPVSAREEEIVFTIGVIALSAKMAKADGAVSDREMAAFRRVVQVTPAEEKNVVRVFNLAKQSVDGYDAYARQLAGLFADRPQILEDILDGLFHIATADHSVHRAEIAYLASVAEIFGFSEAEFERIKARHVEPDRCDPYVVLGLARDVSEAEVKARYRKLVTENHPDRLIARGVPGEFVAIATAKLAAINAAYEQIVRERRPA